MFYKCESLTELIINTFDISCLVQMDEMFYCVKALTNLDKTIKIYFVNLRKV